MKPMTAPLTGLLNRDPEARAYFHTLPPFVQDALRNLNIATMQELQAQAARILYVPF